MRRKSELELKQLALTRLETVEAHLAQPFIKNASFSAYRAWLNVQVAIQDLKMEILAAHHPHEGGDAAQ